MKKIDDIKKLMKGELDNAQMKKLSNVLNVVLNPVASGMSNDEVIEYFLRNKSLVGCTVHTIIAYRGELNRLAKWAGKRRLVELSTQELRDYLAEMKAKNNLSDATLSNKRFYLKSFYSFLFAETVINSDPARGVASIRMEKKLKHAFTDVELEKIRNNCKNLRERALVETLLSTGCRASEVLGMRLNQLNLPLKEIKVYGKGQKERLVYFNQASLYYLEQYIAEAHLEGDDFLFGSKWNPQTSISVAAIEYLLKGIGERAQVKKVHPHRFRRTMATNLLNKGLPIEQFQKLLGHEDMDTTLRYCELKEESIRHNFEKYAN